MTRQTKGMRTTTTTFTLRVNKMQKTLIDKRCGELGKNRNQYIKDLVFRDLLGAGVYTNQNKT